MHCSVIQSHGKQREFVDCLSWTYCTSKNGWVSSSGISQDLSNAMNTPKFRFSRPQHFYNIPALRLLSLYIHTPSTVPCSMVLLTNLLGSLSALKLEWSFPDQHA